MLYKVGQKVRIVPWLNKINPRTKNRYWHMRNPNNPSEWSGITNDVTESMASHKGEVFTIISVTTQYRLDFYDFSHLSFTDEMLEPCSITEIEE